MNDTTIDYRNPDIRLRHSFLPNDVDDPVTVADGLIEDMPFDLYTKIDAYNASAIKRMLRSPLHFIDPIIHPERYEGSKRPELELGKAAHTLVLEPDKYNDHVVVLPELNLRRPAERQKRDELVREAHEQGKAAITKDDQQRIEWIAESIARHRTIRNLFKGTIREVTAVWFDDYWKLRYKARYDAYKRIIANGNRVAIIADLKTAADASYKAFSRAVDNYGYDVQCALYHESYKQLIKQGLVDTAEDVWFIFGVVESSPPFACAVYRLDPASIEVGQRKVQVASRLYVEAMQSGIWESYPDQVQFIELPPWAR